MNSKSSLTLCYPMDCSPPGSSVHGFFQTRILEWVAVSYSRGSSQLRDQIHVSYVFWGFPDSSVGKESACKAEDPSLISGLGRSPGEGIVHPLQYSWASLVAQQVKNLPAMPGSIPGFGRPSGERKGYPLQYSDLKNSMDCIVHGVIKRWT